jgi:hypothetical protein
MEQAVLKYRLFVDGEEKWNYVLTAPVRHEGHRKPWARRI